MGEDNLKPYAFARQRFTHACSELGNADRSINRNVLGAIVALSPLRAEDMPRRCQLLYEKVQHLVGPGLWNNDALSGALASAVGSLPPNRASTVTGWIFKAHDSLDEHRGVEQKQQTELRPNSFTD